MKCEDCKHEVEGGTFHLKRILDGGCLVLPQVEYVIFLDIDGVLNSQEWFESMREELGHMVFREMDPGKVGIFNRIIDETGAKVVLSSAWRCHDNWRDRMLENGITDAFIDRTGQGHDGIRGAQIREWVLKHKELKRYAIIDDDDDMLWGQPLFKTDWKTGLTDEIADQVIEYMNGDKKYTLTEREYGLV